MNALFRIFTESREDFDKVTVETVGRAFQGYTVYHSDGIWQGHAEKSLVVEILANDEDFIKIKDIAREIKSLNFQQAVLIQRIANHSELV